MKLGSFTAIPPAIMMDDSLAQTDKLLYGVILGFALNSRKCIASNVWLGKSIGVTDKAVEKSITRLIDKGLVKRYMKNPQNRLSLQAILDPSLREEGHVPTGVGHTILGNILDIPKGIEVEDKSSPSKKATKTIPETIKEYGNADINKLQAILKRDYPHVLTGITDRRQLNHLKLALTKRKGKDNGFNNDWRANYVQFMEWYKEDTEKKWWVRSVPALKAKVQAYREMAGTVVKVAGTPEYNFAEI